MLQILVSFNSILRIHSFLIAFTGLYVCSTCTAATGRRTVSEYLLCFTSTYSPCASTSHLSPISCSLGDSMSITIFARLHCGLSIFRINGVYFCLSFLCVLQAIVSVGVSIVAVSSSLSLPAFWVSVCARYIPMLKPCLSS